MRITLTKSSPRDEVAITRADGSRAAFGLPSKGPYPHDAYHFFVERELGLERGFWGLVAGGMSAEAVQDLAIAGGHPSAKRAGTPAAAIVQLLQAERLVECFEAASWSGGADDEAIMAMAVPGWEASHVPPPPGVPERLEAIRKALGAFFAEWRELPEGGTFSLEWPETVGEQA